jgi:hypothetical protein
MEGASSRGKPCCASQEKSTSMQAPHIPGTHPHVVDVMFVMRSKHTGHLSAATGTGAAAAPANPAAAAFPFWEVVAWPARLRFASGVSALTMSTSSSSSSAPCEVSIVKSTTSETYGEGHAMSASGQSQRKKKQRRGTVHVA